MPTRADAKLFVLLALSGTNFCDAAVLDHAKFSYKDNVIASVKNPELRLNAKGGDMKAGDPLVLYPCQPHVHEMFNMSLPGQIRLVHNPNMCINAKGGVGRGTSIVTYPCSAGGVTSDNELFEQTADGRIHVLNHPEMCLNIKEANIALGAELVLWECNTDDAHMHDVFEYDAGQHRIFPKSKPELHLNIKGGNTTDSSDIVLWSCQAHAHETFEFTASRQLKLKGTNLCVHGDRGLGAGISLILWQCSDVPGDNEMFAYDLSRSVIYSVKEPSLGFNVKEANIAAGAEIVLWQLDEKAHPEL